MGIALRAAAAAAGALFAGGVAVYAGTGPFEDRTTRNDDGEIVASGGLGAFALELGDCINGVTTGSFEVASVEGVPCDEPHEAEVYAIWELENGDDEEYSAFSVMRHAADGCLDRWPAAIGTDYEQDKELDFDLLGPSPSSWSVGDREVTCLVMPISGEPLIGSRRIA